MTDNDALRRAFSAGYLSALHRLRAKQRMRERDYADMLNDIEAELEAAVVQATRAIADAKDEA